MKMKCCEYGPRSRCVNKSFIIERRKDMKRVLFKHFAVQVDPVTEFIQLGSTLFKDSAILVPKLADPPFWWKSDSTPSKSGSSLPDLDPLICCTI